MIKGIHITLTPSIQDVDGNEISELSIYETEPSKINSQLKQTFGAISEITIYKSLAVARLEIKSKKLDSDFFKWDWIREKSD